MAVVVSLMVVAMEQTVSRRPRGARPLASTSLVLISVAVVG
jgi:hypothetical protein